jgi:glycine dehydrogenase subunit 1
MGTYIPHTRKDQEEMLASIAQTWDSLLSTIPSNVKLKRELNLPEGLSEFEVYQAMKAYASQNVVFHTILRGAGAYDHFIPSVVRHLSAREEFVTAYTPYQSELSQGVLQSIFEFQSMMASLTGMDAANASVYDGATAAAEAIAMSYERNRRTVLLSSMLHPHTIEVIKTYTQEIDVTIKMIDAVDGRTSLEHLQENLDESVCAVLVSHPNYYGILEDVQGLRAIITDSKVKYIVSVNPLTLGRLANPGSYGADIVVGEAQPFGLSLAFGGPYLGFMCTSDKYVRRLPGRIIGQTVDSQGKRAFTLTLQAREQHIRREKASSSICSNQAHCALTAAMYLGAVGPKGLKEVATQCANKAHAFASKLESIGYTLSHQQPFFHEFVTQTPVSTSLIEETLAKHGILSGLILDEHRMLWCVSETTSDKQLDVIVNILKEVQHG